MGKAYSKEVDWDGVHKEYVAHACSLRELEKRYGVSKTAICRRAQREGWAEERKAYSKDALTAQAAAEGTARAEGMIQCVQVAKRILERLEASLDTTLIEAKDYRALTGAIKDIVDIFGSDLDIQRKRAEIEALRARTRADTEGPSTIRVIMGDAEQYAD